MTEPQDRITSPFLIGITGHMDVHPEDIGLLKQRLERVFLFLKQGALPLKDEHEDKTKRRLQDVLELLVPNEDGHETRAAYEHALSHWKGLRNTPVIVQTGLAPGADSIVAEAALKFGFQVRGVLPFDHDLYRDASTFVTSPPAAGERKLTAEEEARLNTYNGLVREIKNQPTEQNLFAVRLPTDDQFVAQPGENPDLSPESLRKQMKADLSNEDKTNRRKRYYAAGEYLAVTSHLLLAFWNGDHDDSQYGTSAVIKARLEGPKSDALPTTQSLRMPHGGPLLVFHARRLKAGSAVPPPEPLKFQHPFEPVRRQSVCPEKNESIKEYEQRLLVWYSDSFVTFARVAENLEGFNTFKYDGVHKYETHFNDLTGIEIGERVDKKGKCKKDKCKKVHSYLFQDTPPDEIGSATSLNNADRVTPLKDIASAAPQHDANKVALLDDIIDVTPLKDAVVPQLEAGLRRVAYLRRFAADAQGQQDEKLKGTLARLFRFTLVAAICWHVFAHWHPHGHKPEKDEAQRAEQPEVVVQAQPKAKPQIEPCETHAPSWVRTGAGSAALAISFISLLYFAWQHSKRLGEQAHDFRAIAEGVRVQFFWNLAGLGESASASYMQRQRSELDWIRGAVRSTSMPYAQWRDGFQRLKVESKIAVLQAVCDSWIKHQQRYYEKTCKEHHFELHAWHKLGKALALSGVLSGIVWWASDTCHSICGFLHGHCATMGMLVGFLIVLGIAVLATRWEKITKHLHHIPEDHDLWALAVHHAVTEVSDTEWPLNTTGQRFIHKFCNFVLLLPISLMLTIIVIAVCVGLQSYLGNTVPSAHNWGIIMSGGLLVTGALAVAWAEKNLFSELAYQYQTMNALFSHAADHVERELKELRREQQDPTKQAAFDARLKELQKFLLELGREALDENAEWLILHRARPLEPVMAG